MNRAESLARSNRIAQMVARGMQDVDIARAENISRERVRQIRVAQGLAKAPRSHSSWKACRVCGSQMVRGWQSYEAGICRSCQVKARAEVVTCACGCGTTFVVSARRQDGQKQNEKRTGKPAIGYFVNNEHKGRYAGTHYGWPVHRTGRPGRRAAYIQVTCDQCGRTFDRAPGEQRKRDRVHCKHNYCGLACMLTWRRNHPAKWGKNVNREGRGAR